MGGAFHRPALAASTRAFSAMPLAPRAQVSASAPRHGAAFCVCGASRRRVTSHSYAGVPQAARTQRNAAATRMDLLAPAQIYEAVAEAGTTSRATYAKEQNSLLA